MTLHPEMAHVLRRFVEVLDEGHLNKLLKTPALEMLDQALDGWNMAGRSVLRGDPCGEKLTLKLADIMNRRMAPEQLLGDGEVLHPGCELFISTHGNKFILLCDADGEWWWGRVGEYEKRSGGYMLRADALLDLRHFVEDPAKVTDAQYREWFRFRGFKWLKPTEKIKNPQCQCGAGRPTTLYWNKDKDIYCQECLAGHLKEDS